MKRMSVVAIMVLCLCGCSMSSGSKPVVPARVPIALVQAQDTLDALQLAVGDLKPIAEAMNQTGVGFSPSTADMFESRLAKIEAGAGGLAGALTTISAIPGPQQPIIGGTAGVVTAVVGLLGVLGTIVQTLRKRKTTKAVDAMVEALDSVSGGGKSIVAIAPKYGVSELIEDRYRVMKGK